jgi:hypothetical protein
VLVLTVVEQRERSGCLLGPRSRKKDQSIVSINFGALCSAAGNTRASRHPSEAATGPDGTAALRGATATDPDTSAG